MATIDTYIRENLFSSFFYIVSTIMATLGTIFQLASIIEDQKSSKKEELSFYLFVLSGIGIIVNIGTLMINESRAQVDRNEAEIFRASYRINQEIHFLEDRADLMYDLFTEDQKTEYKNERQLYLIAETNVNADRYAAAERYIQYINNLINSIIPIPSPIQQRGLLDTIKNILALQSR